MTWRQVAVTLGLAGLLVAAAILWTPRGTLQRSPAVTPVTASYGEDPAQQLDLYSPAGVSSPGSSGAPSLAPVVVYIHGGGWAAGDKSAIPTPLVNLLTAQGYAVASIDYRLTGQARFPAQLDDTRAAIGYLRRNASDVGIDPDRIVLSGDSAGAHLAQLAAVTKPDSGIRGVISYYGLSDLPAVTGQRADAGCRGRYFDPAGPSGKLFPDNLTDDELARAAADASPVTHVDSADSPMLFLHGTGDCIVPPAQSGQMQAALSDAGVDAQTILLDAGHSDLRFFTDATTAAAVLEFLAAVTT